jgi:hypothetical protein
MRMWIILLTLYSTNGQPAENIIVPGVYTQSQCVAVKAIMDQDHDTRLNTRGPGSAKFIPYFTAVECVDRTKFMGERH